MVWGKILDAAKRFGIGREDAMLSPKVPRESSKGFKCASAINSGPSGCSRSSCHSRRRVGSEFALDDLRPEGWSDFFISACAVAIGTDPAGAGSAPEWIELIPAGKFSAVDGRGPFENTDPDSIIAASIAKMPQVGLVLDYDHSTDLAAPEGRPAPAAGWLKEFKVERGAIFARVEWTADAAEAVKAKKYRYVSPVFEHSKDGKVERILRAALTNNPALINLPAIASAQTPPPSEMRTSQTRLPGSADAPPSESFPMSNNGVGPAGRMGEGGQEAMAEYAYTDSDGEGHLPIYDAAHVRNALARFGQTFFESLAKARTAWSHILSAAKRFGIKHEGQMPKPKIKEPSLGYKKASKATFSRESCSMVAQALACDGKVVIMAREEDGKTKLSEILQALERAHPAASHKKLLKAAVCLMADDDDDDGDGESFKDWAEEEEREHEHAGAYDADDPDETTEQMARRHEEEMARCSSDEERSETAARHAHEKEVATRRMSARREREEAAARHLKQLSLEKVARCGLELEGKPGGHKEVSARMSQLIARHPMVVQMANDLGEMRAAQAKARATEKVDAAIRDGRLIPSQREWAIAYCVADAKGFDRFIGAQPRILQAGPDGTFTGRIGEALADALTQKELMVCENLGISVEKFAAAKKTRLSHNVHLD